MKSNRLFLLYLFVFVLAGIKACRERETQATSGNYGIITFTDNFEKEYLLTTDSLTAGNLNIPENAGQIYSLIFSCHNGYYYGIDDGKPVFTRYDATPTGLEPVAQIPLPPHLSWKVFQSWYNWIDESTLFLGSTQNGHTFVYCIINVKDMQIVRHGELDIPLPPERIYGGIMGQFRDNQLLISYTYYQGWNNPAPASDTTYLAVIDYPSLKTKSIYKDTRSTWPGGIFLHAPTSFIDESGDIYLITAPGGRTHPHPTAVSGIFRIGKGEETFDPGYFVPVVSKDEQEAYMLYYLGNGKALVRTVEKSLIMQYEDYLYRPVAGYSLVDLRTGTTKKLDLPPGMLDFTETVLVEDSKVYIAIAESAEESYIWQYNMDTEEITRGLRIEGRVMVLNRLHKK